MNEIVSLLSWVRESRPRKVVVLTGAGVSAESGIPTFRGPGGLWESHRPEELATPDAFDRDPELVWRWYEWRRALIRGCEPNAAHLAIAKLERSLPEGSVLTVTQNVDGLHQRAGSRNVLELHGSILRVRCVREGRTFDHPEPFTRTPPLCECGSFLRPDVVWFGEALPAGSIERAGDAVSEADLVIVAGTSGVVYPAAGLVHLARRGVAVEINPDETPLSDACRFSIRSTAAVAVPPITAAITEVS